MIWLLLYMGSPLVHNTIPPGLDRLNIHRSLAACEAERQWVIADWAPTLIELKCQAYRPIE